MIEQLKSYESVLAELEELRMQLHEATETIEAIRTGQVDALVVQNGNGHQLYTLKSADQTYRVFIEKMKEGAVTLNKDGIILYSNSQFASMMNMPLSKVIGVYFAGLIPADSRQTFEILMEKGWHSDSKGEIFLPDKNNELVPFLLSFTAIEIDEGEALSIVLTDLAAQKQTEEQLKQKNKQLEEARLAVTKVNEHLEELVNARTHELFLSREHFKFLADNIPVMVWTAQPDGSTHYLNKQWYEYTGLSFEQSKGDGWIAALHPDDLDITMNTWKECVEKVKTFEIEYRIKRASDQMYRWHLGKGEPFQDEAGNVVAWFGTSTDIEDQKKEIEKKDEFISVASHELKTPLTSLKGYLQLMENQEHLPDNTRLYISRGNVSVNKLQHLINDLLDVSRIKAGKLEYDKSVIDLGELVASCVENSSCMYPLYDIKMMVERDIMVLGNAERLEQVLMNLINNAVKYSNNNKEIIVCIEKNSASAVVSVIDHGIGLSRADQKRVFERFYRSEENKFIASGLGMGLYIAAEIIKEHNGKISVKSKPNEGAVFSFSLPLIDAAE